MNTFKQFLAEGKRSEAIAELSNLFEHEVYKKIPGTTNSYRQDSANTNTKTQKHSHVYAKQRGGGEHLYAVNVDGSGHDGSSGTHIPAGHAEHFRSLGYEINLDNVLESIELEQIEERAHQLVFLEDI